MYNSFFIDFEDGLKRVMNNRAFYVKMLVKFKDDPNIKNLENALTANDYEKAQIAAHTLKGLSGNLSLTELFKQSREIETQIKAKSVTPDQLGILKDVYNQTLVEVEKVITENE
ncbi:MAG: Hpt domain-containing protein [Treponema sp.]|jgi:HPt (histidine-containing phosphotransfer) domain-containing protein|nr:Hpt domain-containing protein [Treponema sp.]